MGYSNIQYRVGNGWRGWPVAAPFDAITVTAAAELPTALVDQPAPSRLMIVMIVRQHETQFLTSLTRDPDGNLHVGKGLLIGFAPCVGNASDSDDLNRTWRDAILFAVDQVKRLARHPHRVFALH